MSSPWPPLDPAAVRAFLSRDWGDLRDRKDRHLVELARRDGGERTLQLADELRRHVERHARCETAAQRAQDLADLIELKRKIDAASAGLRR